eukprot:5378372-Prymnesium_polylepis.1
MRQSRGDQGARLLQQLRVRPALVARLVVRLLQQGLELVHLVLERRVRRVRLHATGRRARHVDRAVP